MQQIHRISTLFLKPLLWLAIITVLCLIPAEDLPGKSLTRIPHFDKMVHFGMYFVLAVLLAKPLKALSLPVWPVTLLVSVLAGGLIEILQLTLTSLRSASLFDFIAGIAGAVAGLMAFHVIVKGRWLERYV